jgi:hypothetical protein
MIWLGWRQQRTETLMTAALLVLLAALLVPTGITIASAYHDAGLADCAGQASCRDAIDAFTQRFDRLGQLISWLTMIPGLIGILLAAPFLSQLETGTYRLDWTQSITRGRWIAGKLGLAIVTALVTALLLTALVTWWRAPFVHLHGRITNDVFDSEGTVVFGYTLFALGLAAAVGAVWRRTVPSLVVGFAGYFVARLFVDTELRQHFVAPLSATWSLRGPGPDLSRAWIITQYPTDARGHPIEFISCGHGGSGACKPAGLDSGFMHAVYQPASHFWPIQGIETALFAGAALALLAFAAWWTHRRA